MSNPGYSPERQHFHDHIYSVIYPQLNKAEGTVNKIIHYVNADNYLQILYTYKIDTIQILMAYFLEVEDYDTCAIIRDMIKNYNKSTGKNLKLI